VHTVSQSSCGRLVDDTLHFQTGNLPSFFGSLTLSIVEVSRNCDYSFSYFLSQEILSSALHFLKNHCRNLLRCIGSVTDFDSYGVIWSLFYFIGSMFFLCRN